MMVGRLLSHSRVKCLSGVEQKKLCKKSLRYHEESLEAVLY